MYTNCRLSVENCQLLVAIIDTYARDTNLNTNKEQTSAIFEFKGLLKYFISQNIDFELKGD